MPKQVAVRGAWVRWLPFVLALCLATLVTSRARAVGPMVVGDVPPELQPWVPWVLDGLGEERCPELGDTRVCFWPGALTIDAGEVGATFTLRVEVDHDAVVPLPGSAEHWPEDVRDGAAPVIVLGAASPVVSLERGVHELSGRFVWDKSPESLAIPAAIGLVSLRVRGVDMPQARRDKADSVWLGRSENAAPDEPERVEIEVFRRLTDGVPFRIDTRVVLRVSGRARELALGRPLLPASRPLALTAGIPVRLDEQGTLYAQVRAGEHLVELAALLPTPPTALGRPTQAAPWPDQEIWTFAPAPNLRQVQVSGLIGIDPARTNLPEDWRELSAYVAGSDGKLTFATVQRGQAVPPPNSVTLARELWLDADGRAYTVRDRVQGQMNRDWRLELLTGELGHVKVGGEDQLVTVGESGHRGIEVRTGTLDLVAEWRQPSGASAPIPGAGWSTDLESAQLELNLPAGWRFLGAWGVDEASDGWLEPWNLFGLVYVLVVALVLGRLTRWYWGAVALVALGLCHEYAAAPYLTWGVLLALLALYRVLGNRLARTVVGLGAAMAALVLVVSTVTFASKQLRAAAFPDPDLDDGHRSSARALLGAAAPPMGLAEAPGDFDRQQVLEEAADNKEGGSGARAKGEEGSMGRGAPSSVNQRYAVQGPKQKLWQQLDVNAVVQTGPGIPQWSGRVHRLSFRGPAAKDAKVRAFVLAPWQVSLLGLLRVLALLAAVYAVVSALVRAAVGASSASPGEGPRSPGARQPSSSTDEAPSAAGSPAAPAGPPGAAVVMLAIGIVLASLASPRPAAAEVPPAATLQELKQRLTRAPDCGEACLSVPSLALAVRDATVELEVEVHVGKATAYQLPGPATSWVPRSVVVDGQPTNALVLRDDGYLHLRLEPGRHRVALAGPVGTSDLTLTLGAAPRRVRVDAVGWEVDGVRDGKVEGSLHLSRKAAEAPDGAVEPERARASLPPWLEIHRRLEIGVTWKLRTTVTRVSRADEPLAIRYPLLPGEEVTESSLVAERGAVLLSLGRDQKELEFSSVIKPVENLGMVAAKDQPWSEVWSLECGVVWHCETDGIAPEQHQADGNYQPRFRPWPGERVTFAFSRPAAAPGASTTIDRAAIDVTPESSLTAVALDIRTSTGGIHSLTLPADAMVMRLEVQGKSQPIQLREGQLAVVLEPGSQSVSLTFRHPRAGGPWLSVPAVRVGPAVNATTRLLIPEGHFALFTTGPGRGGVVLYWGVLALLVAAALGLSYLPYHPLARWEWAVLALGFPLVPWPLLVPVAGWFFVIGWRATFTGPATMRKNLVQLLLVLTTLFAGGVVLGALSLGLVASPNVLLTGAGSSERSVAFVVDRVLADAALPQPWVLVAPDWVWRAFHLAWAAFLAWLLYRVGRFAWAAFIRDGVLGPLRWSPAPAGLASLDVRERASAEPVAPPEPEADEEDTVRVLTDAEFEAAPAAEPAPKPAPGDEPPDER